MSDCSVRRLLLLVCGITLNSQASDQTIYEFGGHLKADLRGDAVFQGVSAHI